MVISRFQYFKEKYNILLVIIVVSVYLLLQLLFLDRIPNIMVDEPWYANVAYNFVNGKGLVNTNPGSGGGEQLVLYTYMLGVFFKIFGTSLFSARLFSVVGGMLGLFGLICILFECKVDKKAILFCCLLYIFANVNYIIFRSVRPDGWVVVFAIWAYYFFLLAINSRKEFFNFLSGLFVSFTFLYHPNGALYILLFGILVTLHSAQHKNFKFFLNFLMGCLVILGSFICYSLYSGQLELSKWILRTSLDTKNPINFFTSIFHNFSLFAGLYTLGIKRLFILIFEIGILFIGLYHYRNRNLFVCSIIGASYFFLAIILLKPFPTRHFGAVLIFSIITYGLILKQFEAKRKVYKIFCIIGVFYFVNNFAGDLHMITRQYNHIPYDYITKKIDDIVPDQSKVLSLMHFWFSLKNNDNYNSYTRWGEKEYSSLEELLNSGDLNFVIISDYLTKGITPTSGRKTNEMGMGRHYNYYVKAHDYASKNGELISVIDGNNYGNIEIWKIK